MSRGFYDNKYELKVFDQRKKGGYSNEGAITSGVLVYVYDAGTKTESTLYSDKDRTSLANPITRAQFATDEGIEFYSSSASHDIMICDDEGNNQFYAGITPNDHMLPLDKSSDTKLLMLEWGTGTGEVDSGLDLPYGALVEDVFIYVDTADSGETLDVGLLSTETAGDADGFLNGISVAATGLVYGSTITTGLNDTYVSAVTYGALFSVIPVVGADIATDTGSHVLRGHHVTGSNAVSITYTHSAGTPTSAGKIFVKYRMIPV